jgi:hypothetical protein
MVGFADAVNRQIQDGSSWLVWLKVEPTFGGLAFRSALFRSPQANKPATVTRLGTRESSMGAQLALITPGSADLNEDHQTPDPLLANSTRRRVLRLHAGAIRTPALLL